MGNPAAVWKRSTDEEPLDLELPKPRKRRKRRLNEYEYDEVLVSYWHNRPETAHDREKFIAAAMDWVIYAFLFENGTRGQGRNHEITDSPDTRCLMDRLDASCFRMMRTVTCKVEMRSVCWWDVQEHCHNLIAKQIDALAEDLMEALIFEAIEQLKASGFLSWHSGVWTLSATMSLPYIQRLKRRGRIFLAPEPSKLAGEYAA